MEILRSDAASFNDDDWSDPGARTMTIMVGLDGHDSFAWLLNAAENGVEFTVPPAPGGEWSLEVSSDHDQHVAAPVTTLVVHECSFTLLRSAASTE